MPDNRQVLVIGHQNPDTDSVCSAIAYAELKNLLGDQKHIPCRAGEINQETAFVLQRFGIPVPMRVNDVSAQVMDIDIRNIPGISGSVSMRKAWEKMRDLDIHSLPVITEDNKVEGIITIQDIALANMDGLDAHALSQASVPIKNLLETLKGELVCGSEDQIISKGKIVIGAASPDVMEATVQKDDIVLLANRYEAQLCAIELNASCLVVCLAPSIAKTIIKLARENGCTIISTPYDTYAAAQLITQSIPVSRYMKTEVNSFKLSTSVDEAKRIMGQVRFNYFPVTDNNSEYCGMVSKRNLLNLKRKQLVLVDHNERAQCVDGIEEADILGIIDHHRIGDLETSGPVFFRNQPVGCTATIIYQMYLENGVKVPENIAGILCCAILSDTLALHSPTCTKTDENAINELSKIAGVDIADLTEELFDAAEDLKNQTPEDVLRRDYKIFVQNGVRFGVSQGTYNTESIIAEAEKMMHDYLPSAVSSRHVDMLFYIATSVPRQSSDVICAGSNSSLLLQKAFNVPVKDGRATLPGMMSRKKQFIPALLNALSESPNLYLTK
ncbi:MAG: putative manganese-dependent inorganic diphosphatase [Clostridia bacterium]|nr:putative manganese-dependent inorganic diphosphatase [Clostridia bacterium]